MLITRIVWQGLPTVTCRKISQPGIPRCKLGQEEPRAIVFQNGGRELGVGGGATTGLLDGKWPLRGCVVIERQREEGTCRREEQAQRCDSSGATQRGQIRTSGVDIGSSESACRIAWWRRQITKGESGTGTRLHRPDGSVTEYLPIYGHEMRYATAQTSASDSTAVQPPTGGDRHSGHLAPPYIEI